MYLELKAVLGDLGVYFPVFEQHDPQWNHYLLHALFLRQIATFARLGKLDEARKYLASEAWKKIYDEYAYGPPME